METNRPLTNTNAFGKREKKFELLLWVILGGNVVIPLNEAGEKWAAAAAAVATGWLGAKAKNCSRKAMVMVMPLFGY